jgi:hypothetical protein
VQPRRQRRERFDYIEFGSVNSTVSQPRRQRRERFDYIEFGSVNSTVSQPRRQRREGLDFCICMTESVICSHQLSTHLSNLSFTS